MRRRLCGRALETAVNDSLDRTVGVVQQIARADNTAPAMIAVKLAAGMVVDFPRDLTDPDNHTFPMQAWERAALVSAYRAAVKSGGFDPVAEWQATPGI